QLREAARPVPREDIGKPWVESLVCDLVETMRDAHGAGLAAPQILEPWQVCVMEIGDNPRYPYKPKVPLTVLINPVITPLGDESFENYEGCLSVPNLRGIVRRHARIRLQALDARGAVIDREFAGITAGTVQHEVDHLFGQLFVDRVEDTTTLTTWDQFSRYREADFRRHVEAVVAQYGS
ncbi:MAG: peptide deformylase, partial [Myxococcota bacterium]